MSTIERATSTSYDIVMLGDSLTAMLDWGGVIPKHKIDNMGCSGDATKDVLKRIPSILSTGAKKVFIMVGINDIARDGESVQITFKNYIAIINAIQSNNMQVFVQSTIECSKNPWGDLIVNYMKVSPDVALNRVRELNKHLNDYCNQNKITFININANITSNPEGLLAEYTYDGVHLRPPAYLNWINLIYPYFY
jgi:lysophospholipase L1-like esterase